MELFIKRVCFAILAFVLLASLSLWAMVNIRGRWNEIVLVDIEKRNVVDAIEGKKLVFVGGSNLSYGMDSEMVQDSLGITTYNMGLHAGIGLSYMLYEASQYMNRGDILVLIPEYNQFTRFNGSSALADLLFQSRRFSDFKFYKDWGSYPSYLCARVFVPFLLSGGNPSIDRYADNPEGFNNYGDYILHLDQPRREFPRLGMEKRPEPKEIAIIVDRIKEIESMGVRVVMLPPPYAETSFALSKEYVDIIDNELKSNGMPFLSETERYSLNDSLFWNSAYHLGAEGRLLRTSMVIEDLRRVLAGNR